jgi:RHS repeat-associated protein
VGLTNTSGALVNTYTYDPYGNVVAQTGTTPNRWGYAGGYRDPGTGFLKFGQRYYDPILGRWTQPGPEPASVLNPAIASTFSYVGGDPVNKVDPTGFMLMSSGGGGWTPKWTPTWTPKWSPRWTPVTPHPVLSSAHHASGSTPQWTSHPSASPGGLSTGQRIGAGVTAAALFALVDQVLTETLGSDVPSYVAAGNIISSVVGAGGVWMLLLAFGV